MVLRPSFRVSGCPAKSPAQRCHLGVSKDARFHREQKKVIARRRLSKTACYPLTHLFISNQIQTHQTHFNTLICCFHLIIKAPWLNSLPRTRAHRSQLLIYCILPWSSRLRDVIPAQFPIQLAQTSSPSPVLWMPPSRLALHHARVP